MTDTVMSDAPIVHEFQIRESDPWYGEFVATEGETWFVFAHEFKAYREWVLKMGEELQAKVVDVQAGVSALEHERDTWKRVAERAGVCMTCALGAPDISIGCTDCLNTGFAHGAPQGYVSEGFYEEKVGKLQRRLENRQDTINVLEEIITRIEPALKAAHARFSDIADGRAFQPRLHAATGAAEAQAALPQPEKTDVL